MNAQILDEISQENFGSKALLRLIVLRIIKTVVLCLAFTSLFGLMLLEDYTWLFLSLVAISGLVIFWALRFVKNSLGGNKEAEDPYDTEAPEADEPEKTSQITTVRE
jgi:hypothetical protein